jgi:hypothetical protein
MQMMRGLLKQVLPNLQQDLASHQQPLPLHLLLGLAHPPLQGGAPGPSTFHDPGGHGPHSSPPPVFYEYPSLRTTFSQRLSDLVGRSRKEDALAILKEFDKSTKRAQEYARKASEYATRSRDLMASAHQECVSSINKLLADATAAKQASKGRRRKAANVTQPSTGMFFFLIYISFS